MASHDERSGSIGIGDGDIRKENRSLPLFGQRVLQCFEFDPSLRYLNHGSFGASPRDVRKKLRQYQDLAEASPDRFIRYETAEILHESRAALAKLLHAPTDTVVLVPNTTTGVNTILRNISWNDDCRDEILYFSTVYGACGKTIDYVVDSGLGRVSSRAIQLKYPLEDNEVLALFKDAVDQCIKDRKRGRIAVFDTVSSLPGVRLPFEEITKACREAGILSLVDGAQGVGMIDINLEVLDPDFFVSGCHKWLYVPRSCAVLYVPLRNQTLIASTVPTSHGYVPKVGERFNPLPKTKAPVFVNSFEYVGTQDMSAYLCVKDAITWREEVLGGEARILEYIQTLAREGGKRVAQILGTEVLENKAGTMGRCAMTNVALPLRPEVISSALQWMLETMMADYQTFMPLIMHNGRLWARISAQTYLSIGDFEWAGLVLLDLCRRVEKGEYQIGRS
ncbi:PLP-dependent transferase [Hypoxylon sp. NC1633]|nr:PLP-dependent transferase [Hypoxylon sp. NC1633]